LEHDAEEAASSTRQRIDPPPRRGSVAEEAGSSTRQRIDPPPRGGSVAQQPKTSPLEVQNTESRRIFKPKIHIASFGAEAACKERWKVQKSFEEISDKSLNDVLAEVDWDSAHADWRIEVCRRK